MSRGNARYDEILFEGFIIRMNPSFHMSILKKCRQYLALFSCSFYTFLTVYLNPYIRHFVSPGKVNKKKSHRNHKNIIEIKPIMMWFIVEIRPFEILI